MNRAVLALLLAAAASALPGLALAQTAGPTPDQIVRQQQINQNRFQAQLQADQLQDLQRRNSTNLQQSDPNARADAAVRNWEIQKQIDQNTALRQQMAAPGVDPADVHARIQLDNAKIQQLEQQQPVPLPPR
jgi:hypothetical protein